MTTVRLNYDGWLALPVGMRQKLGLATGDRLELELVDGSITVRPRRGSATLARPAAAPTAAQEQPGQTGTQPLATPAVKRGPGRPRKSALPTPKARGGKRKVAAAPA